MSFLQPSTIQVIAQSIDITKLSDEAAKALAPDVEYRIREVIQEALKFKRHAKRPQMATEDINAALRLCNVTPQYGFTSRDTAGYVRAAGHWDLFCIPEKELGIQEVVDAALPPCPTEVAIAPHWLAVEGTQPQIPENVPVPKSRAAKRRRLEAFISGAARPAQASAPEPSGGGPAGAASGGDRPAVKLPVEHVLSAELQLYFKRVTGLLENPQLGSPGLRSALASLASDPGLQPLVPYLAQAVSEGIRQGLKALPQLTALLSALRSLLVNPHLALENYLHQLIPPILSCLVAKRLGASPSEDHWAVRDLAARLVSLVCAQHGQAFYSIQPRISRTLLSAFADPSKSLPTHYGAVAGLSALGPKVVGLLLLPNMAPYLSLLEPALADAGDPVKRHEASQVFGALLAAVVKLARSLDAARRLGGDEGRRHEPVRLKQPLVDLRSTPKPAATAKGAAVKPGAAGAQRGDLSASTDTAPHGDSGGSADRPVQGQHDPGSRAAATPGTSKAAPEQDAPARGVSAQPAPPLPAAQQAAPANGTGSGTTLDDGAETHEPGPQQPATRAGTPDGAEAMDVCERMEPGAAQRSDATVEERDEAGTGAAPAQDAAAAALVGEGSRGASVQQPQPDAGKSLPEAQGAEAGTAPQGGQGAAAQGGQDAAAETGSGAAEQALRESWKEDGALWPRLDALRVLFGEALLPFMPEPHLCSVLL